MKVHSITLGWFQNLFGPETLIVVLQIRNRSKLHRLLDRIQGYWHRRSLRSPFLGSAKENGKEGEGRKRVDGVMPWQLDAGGLLSRDAWVDYYCCFSILEGMYTYVGRPQGIKMLYWEKVQCQPRSGMAWRLLVFLAVRLLRTMDHVCDKERLKLLHSVKGRIEIILELNGNRCNIY